MRIASDLFVFSVITAIQQFDYYVLLIVFHNYENAIEVPAEDDPCMDKLLQEPLKSVSRTMYSSRRSTSQD